jgi:hypothetical protein
MLLETCISQSAGRRFVAFQWFILCTHAFTVLHFVTVCLFSYGVGVCLCVSAVERRVLHISRVHLLRGAPAAACLLARRRRVLAICMWTVAMRTRAPPRFTPAGV